MMGLNFAVDLDGTIAKWGVDHAQCGEWMDGAVDALTTLRRLGHNIVVHSCRATWEQGGGVQEIARFLRSGGFVPFVVASTIENGHQINLWRYVYPDGTVRASAERYVSEIDERAVGIWVGVGKPIAHAYVDDRAIPFEGDWPTLIAQIEATF